MKISLEWRKILYLMEREILYLMEREIQYLIEREIQYKKTPQQKEIEGKEGGNSLCVPTVNESMPIVTNR